jgi:ABC-type uncharacterized transport system permease subunit
MGVSREVVTMLQAVIVIAVVVAWELTRRASLRRQRRLAGMLDQEDAADGPIAAGSRA